MFFVYLPHGKSASRIGFQQSVLEVFKGLEVGHIFKLGTKYSASMKAHVLKADGGETPIVMGSYGIGVERIMAGAVELHHDQDGIAWPFAIAPFHAAVLTLGKEPELGRAEELAVKDVDLHPGAEPVRVLRERRNEPGGPERGAW